MLLNKKKKFHNYLVSDLNEILQRNQNELIQFQDQNILIAGANGFIGNWLTAALLYSKQELNLNFEIGVICRNMNMLNQKFKMRPKEVSFFHELDLNLAGSLQKKLTPKYDSIFNCASSANYANHVSSEKVTQNLIDLTCSEKNRPNFINMSSGAVYGEKLPTRTLILESSILARPTSDLSQYSKDKIDSEKAVSVESGLNRINGTNARLFTFYGPHFPLDSYYAIGNFMQNVVNHSQILVKGNPESVRSYLYPTDLICALLRLSIKPTLDIIHIGSKSGISIGDLANLIGTNLGGSGVDFLETGDNPNFYVPDTSKTEKHLGIFESVDLIEGLTRWAKWLN